MHPIEIYKSPNKRQKKIRKNSLWDHFLIAIDRTQWRDKNLFVVSLIWEKRAWQITYVLLDKKGSSNFQEQKKLIASIIRIFKKYKFVLIGDREFGSVKLAKWLRDKKIKFVFRMKKSIHIELPIYGYQSLSSLELTSGNSLFLQEVKVTRQKGFGTFNVAGYWRRNYRNKKWNEPWYLLTNLSSFKQANLLFSLPVTP